MAKNLQLPQRYRRQRYATSAFAIALITIALITSALPAQTAIAAQTRSNVMSWLVPAMYSQDGDCAAAVDVNASIVAIAKQQNVRVLIIIAGILSRSLWIARGAGKVWRYRDARCSPIVAVVSLESS